MKSDQTGFQRGAGPYSKSPIKFNDTSDNKKSTTRTPTDSDAGDDPKFGYGGALSGTGMSAKLPKK